MRNRNRRALLGWYCAFLVWMLYASPMMRSLRSIAPVQYIRDSFREVNLESIGSRNPWISVTEKESGEEWTEQVFTAESVLGTGKEIRQNWQIRFLGIPVRNITVVYEKDQRLLPGGQCIAISMQTQGVLVVGCTQMMDENGNNVYPAAQAGLRIGDVILKLNGRQVGSAQELSEQMEEFADESQAEIIYLRDGEEKKTFITPVKDPQDGKYRLGLWVRDAMSGIGTLTYVDPEDGSFGALGHGITDADTGSLLNLRSGWIAYADHVHVEASHAGAPGELRGLPADDGGCIGSLKENTSCGIFGQIENSVLPEMDSPAVSIAHAEEVHTGEAEILCELDNGHTERYAIRILRLSRQDRSQTKGILLEVTDERLLEKTGGIIQGMSGSPILQDGKLVGAVTHVLVNHPSRGYGIYIEHMLNAEAS